MFGTYTLNHLVRIIIIFYKITINYLDLCEIVLSNDKIAQEYDSNEK